MMIVVLNMSLFTARRKRTLNSLIDPSLQAQAAAVPPHPKVAAKRAAANLATKVLDEALAKVPLLLRRASGAHSS